MKIGNIECYGVIYKITNMVNGKIYIGQTSKAGGFKKRYDFGGKGIERVYKYLKCCESIKGKYVNTHLLSSIEKYGFENFEVIEVFDVGFSKLELDIKEKSWISIYKTTNREFGYNFTDGGSNGKPSEESILKNKLSKIGKNLGAENPNSRKVICLTTNKVFGSTVDGAAFYNVGRTAISQSCTGRRKTAGKLSNGEKLVWMYYDEYLSDSNEVSKRMSPDYITPQTKCKKVICITTGERFDSILEATKHFGYKSSGNISSCCKNKLEYSGTLEDGTKLIWKYLDEA